MEYKHGGNIYAYDKPEDLLDFSSNINPVGLIKNFKKIIIDSIDSVDKYPDPRYEGLKESIASYYNIESKNIILGNGGIQVIHNAIEFFDIQKALIIAPTFVEYEKALKRFSKNFEYYYLKESEDFTLNIEELFNFDMKDIDLVIICSPNNPTGQYLKKKDLLKVLMYLKRKNTKLMIDESFLDFVNEEESIISLVDTYDHFCVIRSLTKFFSVPGLRLGFLVTSHQKLIDNIKQYRESWVVNNFAVSIGKEVFKQSNYINRTRNQMDRERAYLLKELNKFSFIKVYPTSANYILFKLLVDRPLKEMFLDKGILIRHCNNYKGLSAKFYRVAIKERIHNNQLIQVFKEIMEEENE